MYLIILSCLVCCIVSSVVSSDTMTCFMCGSACRHGDVDVVQFIGVNIKVVFRVFRWTKLRINMLPGTVLEPVSECFLASLIIGWAAHYVFRYAANLLFLLRADINSFLTRVLCSSFQQFDHLHWSLQDHCYTNRITIRLKNRLFVLLFCLITFIFIIL